MSFDMLLGNEQLKKNLAGSLGRGHISHFYLISGPEGAGKHTLARLLAAAILCRGSGKPCLHCGPCRKVMEGSHPDFITIDDPEKKTVPVDLIRQARADIYIQPNESDHKIYLFPRAQDMGIPGQNALLKVLEEPPKYGVFLLLTDNPEKLLPTVRSRCTELKLQSLPQELLIRELQSRFPQEREESIRGAAERSGGYLGQALVMLDGQEEQPPQTAQLVQALIQRDALLLTQVLTPMEKWKRDALAQILASWQELIAQALLSRSGISVLSSQARELGRMRSSQELHRYRQAMAKAYEYTQGNVSPGAVCGWLVWELR